MCISFWARTAHLLDPSTKPTFCPLVGLILIEKALKIGSVIWLLLKHSSNPYLQNKTAQGNQLLIMQFLLVVSILI